MVALQDTKYTSYAECGFDASCCIVWIVSTADERSETVSWPHRRVDITKCERVPRMAAVAAIYEHIDSTIVSNDDPLTSN
jgi:hypothetical protein